MFFILFFSPTLFPCEFFFDSASFGGSELLFEDDIHLSIYIKECHVQIKSALFFELIVFVVAIGDHELTLFDDPEFFSQFIDEVAIM